MQMAQVVLDYLRILLSPAPVAGAVAVFFLVLYRDDISALIRRIATIRFPGGELSTTQLERTAESRPPTTPPPQPAPDPNTLPQDLNLTGEQQQQLIDFVRSERARAALWEYRFLNYYLVPHTQRVLDWLVSLGQQPTVQLYDSLWMPLIPDPNERQAIIGALRAHYLVELHGDLLGVTPKGHEYVGWRGPLPQMPPMQPMAPSVR